MVDDDRASTQMRENRWSLFSHEDRDRIRHAIWTCDEAPFETPSGQRRSMTEHARDRLIAEIDAINQRHIEANK